MINEDYKKRFKDRVRKAMKGDTLTINNPYQRLGKVFNIIRGRFTLIGGTSGSGKTAFADDAFILKPYVMIKDDPSMHYETLYYSMERKKDYKYAKWASWFSYKYGDKQISADKYFSQDGTGVITEEEWENLNKYDDVMSDLLDRVHIYDGRTDYDTLARHIRALAFKLGVLYIADEVGVRINDSEDYIELFSDDKVRETRVGPERFIALKHNGEEFTMVPDTTKYFYDKERTIVQIIVDGIGLIKRGGGTTKSAIDDVIDLLADARDIFDFSIIVISQFNRDLSNTVRRIHSAGNLQPQESDFKDSANHFQAADLALAIFDPYKFSAMDDDEKYKGYHVPSLVTPGGYSRFRTLHILKNTFGISDVHIGLKFLGESNWFESLPRHDDEQELAKAYGKIQLNK